MDSPGIRGLKYTLVAGLTLLTTDALFAQSTDQSGVDTLKAQMNQMQRQYEQRIEAMEAKMKALESNANSGSILNTRVLTDADGKEGPGKAPAPMLDESFLKSLTRNFTFNVYMRAGVAFNGSGGAQGKYQLRHAGQLCRVAAVPPAVWVTKTTSTRNLAGIRLTSLVTAPMWWMSHSGRPCKPSVTFKRLAPMNTQHVRFWRGDS